MKGCALCSLFFAMVLNEGSVVETVIENYYCTLEIFTVLCNGD